MKKSIWLCLFLTALCTQWQIHAESLNLFNDSQYTLRAVINASDGTVLGEFVMNSRDGAQWSTDYMNLGTDIPSASMVPYTVNWFCMGGNSYGVCDDVAPGTLVTAQACGGPQECSNDSPQE